MLSMSCPNFVLPFALHQNQISLMSCSRASPKGEMTLVVFLLFLKVCCSQLVLLYFLKDFLKVCVLFVCCILVEYTKISQNCSKGRLSLIASVLEKKECFVPSDIHQVIHDYDVKSIKETTFRKGYISAYWPAV